MPTIQRTSSKARTAKGPILQFRLRVMHRGEIALGPGKIDLLAAIQQHGSIAKAAKTLGMSYMRAWTLVKVMNRAFREPLVTVERGGTTGGAARVTVLGRRVMRLYAAIVKKSAVSTRASWTDLQKHLVR